MRRGDGCCFSLEQGVDGGGVQGPRELVDSLFDALIDNWDEN